MGRLRQRFKIHNPREQLAQRVQVERVGLIGREKLREHAHELHARHGHAAQPAAHGAHTFPQLAQRLPRQLAAQVSGVFHIFLALCCLCKAVGQYRCIHGTRTGAADALDHQGIIFEQGIQHTPGQRTVRASALQRKIEHSLRLGCCCCHDYLLSLLKLASPQHGIATGPRAVVAAPEISVATKNHIA